MNEGSRRALGHADFEIVLYITAVLLNPAVQATKSSSLSPVQTSEIFGFGQIFSSSLVRMARHGTKVSYRSCASRPRLLLAACFYFLGSGSAFRRMTAKNMRKAESGVYREAG